MTASKLKKAALNQFSVHGYAGASLAAIASEVGMKKQSIYAHFKSKEDLFLSTFSDSVDKEINYITLFIEEHQSDSLKELLENFLESYIRRYHEVSNTSFFMRTSFFPPIEVEQFVNNGTNTFVAKQEEIFLKLFKEHQSDLKKGMAPTSAALCFLTLMDGLFVEMYYGIPDRLEQRILAVWDMYDQILSPSEKEKKNES